MNYIRREKPKVASQLSMCGGAGTGCGWCVPFLKQLFLKETGQAERVDWDALSVEEYAKQRAEYVKSGKGKPPSTADDADTTTEC